MPPAADIVDDLGQRLLEWYAVRRRQLPWRDCDDPYAVLVSEIMLQQTQVERVVPAFERFVARFPTVAALAEAPAADVVTAWRGLGYNRRAIALQEAARAIVVRHGGRVPVDLADLLALPGIGPYTARAIRAFAFGLDDAPVDTNVRRVITRAVTGVALPPRRLQEQADALVPSGRGRDWNAALMDLGSAHCTARQPRCAQCPLQVGCTWSASGGTDPAEPPARQKQIQPFIGSNRFHRGRLLDALRNSAIDRAQVASAAGVTDAGRADALAAGLVADGLAQWENDMLRLPA